MARTKNLIFVFYNRYQTLNKQYYELYSPPVFFSFVVFFSKSTMNFEHTSSQALLFSCLFEYSSERISQIAGRLSITEINKSISIFSVMSSRSIRTCQTVASDWWLCARTNRWSSLATSSEIRLPP